METRTLSAASVSFASWPLVSAWLCSFPRPAPCAARRTKSSAGAAGPASLHSALLPLSYLTVSGLACLSLSHPPPFSMTKPHSVLAEMEIALVNGNGAERRPPWLRTATYTPGNQPVSPGQGCSPELFFPWGV